ncbi:hypothetical protein MKX83_00950 [Cytobacillus sp. FSL M8-0252]|uniref:hypothetical protein n=1 Tax=Cytobacillus sp. FSL M8-0252 TaxID=2921621 RepID=UPI0030FBA5BB
MKNFKKIAIFVSIAITVSIAVTIFHFDINIGSLIGNLIEISAPIDVTITTTINIY